jgi:hypothetical protein
MNSKSVFGVGYKAPMKLTNECYWSRAFADLFTYISNLKTVQGVKLIHSPRKSGFLGFLINLKSFEQIFDNEVRSGNLKYLLGYKFSQDHLELMFCSLRSRLGSNNNPTAKEFKQIYRRYLLHHEIRGDRGNCILQDCTTLLAFERPPKESEKNFDVSVDVEKFGLKPKENVDHDYSLASHWPVLSEYQSAVVEYISGYCVQMAVRELSCHSCIKAVTEEPFQKNYSLVNAKNRGGLIYVNSHVLSVCLTTEKVVKKLLIMSPGLIPQMKNITFALTATVLELVFAKYP